MKKRDIKKVKYYIFLILFILLPIFAVPAQSSYLDEGVSGASFSISSTFGLITFENAGLTTALSIGGVLDVGMLANVGTETVDGRPATRVNLGIVYNLAAFKQNDVVPLTFIIEGSYGLLNVFSDYLDENRLRRQGQGFTIGIRIVRDLIFSEAFLFRLGIVGSYRAYNIVTEYTYTTDPEPVGDPIYPITNREEVLRGGATAGVIFNFGNESGVFLGGDILLNNALRFYFEPELTWFLQF